MDEAKHNGNEVAPTVVGNWFFDALCIPQVAECSEQYGDGDEKLDHVSVWTDDVEAGENEGQRVPYCKGCDEQHNAFYLSVFVDSYKRDEIDHVVISAGIGDVPDAVCEVIVPTHKAKIGEVGLRFRSTYKGFEEEC